MGAASNTDELQRSIVEHRSAVHVEARLGVPPQSGQLIFAPAGFVLTHGRKTDAYRWGELQSVGISRGAIVLKLAAPRERVVTKKDHSEIKAYIEKRRVALRLVIDGVDEPQLTGPFSRVLEDMRTSKFTFKGVSWIEYQNGIDRLHTDFDGQDDLVLPAAAAGLFFAVGLMAMFLVPVGVNAASARAVPAGAFAISDALGPLDPRSIIAGFALSAMFAHVVLRFALGPSASVWTRGAARGWARRQARRPVRFALKQISRLLLASATTAVMFLLALLAFWPNIAATVVVQPSGVRNEVLLPFISLEESWNNAADITRDGPGVTIRFADGRTATTVGHDLRGGTANQFFELTNSWWKAAR
jgi:hypothetical protein